MNFRDSLELLQLIAPVTPEALRSAYRVRVKQCHPDINGNSPENVARFRQLLSAYETVSAHLDRDLAATDKSICGTCHKRPALPEGDRRAPICGDCLLSSYERRLPMPPWQIIRGGFVITLQISAIVVLAAAAWHSSIRLTLVAVGLVLASFALLAGTVKSADRIERTAARRR